MAKAAGRRAVGLLVVLGVGLAASPAAATQALHVIPFPGTPDASRLSNVIFSSLMPSQIVSVSVIGSSSGGHRGHLEALPDDGGTAFVPDQPFAAGEQVQVTADVSSTAAGAASGDPGSKSLNFEFTVAVPAASGAQHAPAASRDVNRPGSNSADGPTQSFRSNSADSPTQSFHSAPDLHPPVVTARHDPDVNSGDIFLGVTHSQQSPGGLMILDSQGRLVWFDPVGYTTNLHVQRYQNRPVLTWWQGSSLAHGEGVIMSRSYRILKIVHAGWGYGVDSHEFQLTGQGTAFIDATLPVRANQSSVGGPANGSVADDIVQEVDVRTGAVLWEWHALGHVPLSSSYQPRRDRGFDYFHLNSIQPLPDGNLIVSARNTWGVYEIDKQTGRVIWTLGGKDSSFKMGPGANFEWQHDPRLHPGGLLSLFDDADFPQEERQSSAKIVRLNTRTMTVSLAARYVHRPPLLASATGSAQVLANGNVFVGWGSQSVFSEYAPGGRQIFSASMPFTIRSYRAYRCQWHAQPLTPPALATVRRANGTTVVWVSWNGATQVASWRVLGGPRTGKLKALATVTRTSFETRIVIHGHPGLVSVQALNARGKILGRSSARPSST